MDRKSGRISPAKAIPVPKMARRIEVSDDA
jgi:hypothetical protein